MKTTKRILSAIMIVVMVFSTSVTAFAASTCSKGHKYDVNHYCATCNVFDSTYTGMARNKTTWYYVKNGKIDTSYTGMAKNQHGWFYIKNGKLDSTYTGMAKNQYGWWYFQNGKLNKTYTGMAKNQYGWWYFKNGKIDTTYTGLAKNQYGWWYMKNGKLDKTYNGLAKNQYGWWYITNGGLDKTYYGVAKNKYGYWYVYAGKVNGNEFCDETSVGRRYITVSTKSISLEVGESEAIIIEAHRTGTFGFTCSANDVICCEWGNWDEYNPRKISMLITGEIPGSTILSFFFDDTPNVGKVNIDVSVAENVTFYDGFGSIVNYVRTNGTLMDEGGYQLVDWIDYDNGYAEISLVCGASDDFLNYTYTFYYNNYALGYTCVNIQMTKGSNYRVTFVNNNDPQKQDIATASINPNIYTENSSLYFNDIQFLYDTYDYRKNNHNLWKTSLDLAIMQLDNHLQNNTYYSVYDLGFLNFS